MKGEELTAKQKQFCNEYLINLNATQAAINAKYSKKTACEQGARLLTNVKVQTYLKKLMSKKDSETIASQDEVLKLLTEAARGEMQEDIVTVINNKAETIKKVTAPRDRVKALELLAKRYGILTDNLVVRETPQIIDDVPEGAGDGNETG